MKKRPRKKLPARKLKKKQSARLKKPRTHLLKKKPLQKPKLKTHRPKKLLKKRQPASLPDQRVIQAGQRCPAFFLAVQVSGYSPSQSIEFADKS